jgi:hypothetical protein
MQFVSINVIIFLVYISLIYDIILISFGDITVAVSQSAWRNNFTG